MNFRSAAGWKDAAPNLQRNSYDYGYGGGRTDLPAVGYNPVYPSYGSFWSTSTDYTPTPISNGVAPRDSNNYAYQGSFQEYNPEYPSYNPVQAQNKAAPTLVRLNSSAFSVKNTLRKRKATPHNVVPIPAATPTTISKGKKKKSKKSKTNGAVNVTADSVPPPQKPVPKPHQTPVVFQVKEVQPSTAEQAQPQNRENQSSMTRHSNGGFSGRGGVQKNYNNWGGSSRGNGWRGGWRGRVSRPQNKQDDIPFEVMPDGTDTITLAMDPDNLTLFHGPSSVFTTQHAFPVLIDGNIFESVDHYYQYKKLKDLCGSVSDKITEMIRDSRGCRLDGQTGAREERKPYSQIAREQLRLSNMDKKKVEEWRCTKGLKAVQDALMAKVSQSAHLREALMETDGKILVHCYAGDSIYGTGTTAPQVRKWCENLKKNGNSHFSIPATFPLTEETVKNVPNFSQGRNILGVILMQLRDMLINGHIAIVDMTAVFDAIKKGGNADDLLLKDLDIGGSNFSIGGGDVQAKLGV